MQTLSIRVWEEIAQSVFALPRVGGSSQGRDTRRSICQDLCIPRGHSLILVSPCAPRCSVAVQRLCRVVTKWTTTHDAMLIRLFFYLDSAGPVALVAQLSVDDLEHVRLTLWSDADLAGDPEDSKSTSGMLLELENIQSGARWPISWGVKRQGATAGSTAEAETVALCTSLKHEALPLSILLDTMLCGCPWPIELVAKVDNTQALSAVTKSTARNCVTLTGPSACLLEQLMNSSSVVLFLVNTTLMTLIGGTASLRL